MNKGKHEGSLGNKTNEYTLIKVSENDERCDGSKKTNSPKFGEKDEQQNDGTKSELAKISIKISTFFVQLKENVLK